jgi:hypothetical protein
MQKESHSMLSSLAGNYSSALVSDGLFKDLEDGLRLAKLEVGLSDMGSVQPSGDFSNDSRSRYIAIFAAADKIMSIAQVARRNSRIPDDHRGG